MPPPEITIQSRPAFGKANEDFVLTDRVPGHSELRLGFLADGQGGRAGGAEAAQAACRAAIESARRFGSAELFSPSTWTEILTQADSRTAASCEGFTTLIGFVAGPEFVCGASSGDSKAWLQTEGAIIELTESQQKNPPIGSGSAIATPFSARCENGSALLAASDGLWKFSGFDAIAKLLQSADAHSLNHLCERVEQRQGGKLPDDLSAILVCLA